jgi:cell division protein FtsB
MFNEVERLRMLGQQAAREVRKVLAQIVTTRSENDVLKKKNKELTEENGKLKTEVNNLKQKQSESGTDAIKTLARIKQIIEARTYIETN